MAFNPLVLQNSAKKITFKSTLYDFQTDCVEWLVQRSRAILNLEMGMGKTIVSIYYVCKMNFDHTVIIVPNQLVDQWYNEFLKHSNVSTNEIYRYTGADRRNKNYQGIRICIVSYSKFLYDKNNVPESTLFDYIDTVDCMICDESHTMRNHKTQIYSKVNEIIRPTMYLLMLSGTPIFNGYIDFINILKLIRMHNSSTGIEDMKKKSYYCKTIKETTLQLPETVRTNIICQMDEKHMVVYSFYLYKLYKALFDEDHDNSLILTLILRLRQTAIHPYCTNMKKTLGNITSNKLEIIFDSVINVMESTDDKVIIFSNFNKTFEILDGMFSGAGYQCMIYNGDCNKKEILHSFNEDKTKRILLANIIAGGVGLNLQIANHVYFVDLPWNKAVHRQAESRVVRIGQKKKVHVTNILCNASIETWMADLIDQKKIVTDKFDEDELYKIDKSLLKEILHTFIDTHSLSMTYEDICAEQLYLNRLENVAGHKFSIFNAPEDQEGHSSEGEIGTCGKCSKAVFQGEVIFVDSTFNMYHIKCLEISKDVSIKMDQGFVEGLLKDQDQDQDKQEEKSIIDRDIIREQMTIASMIEDLPPSYDDSMALGI